MGQIESVRLLINGMLAEDSKTKIIVDQSLERLRSAMLEQPAAIRAIVAFLLLADYAKELDV